MIAPSVILAFAVALTSATCATDNTMDASDFTSPIADSMDVVSVDAIIHALYEVISGEAGEARDWDRFRSLLHPDARLIPVRVNADGQIRASYMSAEDYISRAGSWLEENGFFEHEVSRKQESFGHVVHAFSTYESRRRADDPEPFVRGINSIQLMNDGSRWWVMNVFWEAESIPDRPIPDRYLPDPSR